MDPVDEKFRDVYNAIDKLEAKIILKIEKSEERSAATTTDKLNSLKDLVNQSTTARHETITNELIRLQKNNFDCSGKCASTVKEFDSRLAELEKAKESIDTHINGAPLVQDRISAIEKWKDVNWQRTIIYAAVAIVAAIQVLEWVHKLLPVVQ